MAKKKRKRTLSYMDGRSARRKAGVRKRKRIRLWQKRLHHARSELRRARKMKIHVRHYKTPRKRRYRHRRYYGYKGPTIGRRR